MITVVIDGDPVAKGRPRFRAGRAYTPAKTVAYEDYGRLVGVPMVMAGQKPLAGVLAARVTVRIPVPASWPRKKRVDAICPQGVF